MVNLKRKDLVRAFRVAIKRRKEELKKYPDSNTCEIYYMMGYLSAHLYKTTEQQDKFVADCQKETY